MLLGLAYPTYHAYRAIKYELGPSAELQMLIVLLITTAFIQLTNVILDPVFGDWLPFYHLAKIMFVIWLAVLNPKGAIYLYSEKVEPFIDEQLEEWEEFRRTLDFHRIFRR